MKTRNIVLPLIVISIILSLYYFLDYRRTFYSNYSKNKYVTVWKRLNDESLIIKGKYYGILGPSDNYIKVYKSKHFYICWNDENYDLAFNLGSKIIDKKGLKDCLFLNHSDFFNKYRGLIYNSDGKLIITNNDVYINKQYNIEHIE